MNTIQSIHNDSYELMYNLIMKFKYMFGGLDVAVSEDISFYYVIDNNYYYVRNLKDFLEYNIDNNNCNIIYAGEFHIENYVNILTHAGFTQKYAVAHLNQCLPIGDITLPLFS